MTRFSTALQEIASSSTSRTELWSDFVNAAGITRMAEVGVYRGHFAETLLRECPTIERYYMVDPWRHLDSWNKPANVSSDRFEEFLVETKARTAFAAKKRVILRGRTTEVIDQIPDESLDFAYVDADHTLKGIAIDLLLIYPKVRGGGWIGGDDFSETVWQHGQRFEPTLVFPYAVYFAEAGGVPIYGLPHRQFLICKDQGTGFSFIDLTGRYRSLALRDQFGPARGLTGRFRKMRIRVGRLGRRMRRIAGR